MKLPIGYFKMGDAHGRGYEDAHPHLIRTSGSDYHRTQDLATGGMETDRAIHTPAELVQCLKDNAFTRIGG